MDRLRRGAASGVTGSSVGEAPHPDGLLRNGQLSVGSVGRSTLGRPKGFILCLCFLYTSRTLSTSEEMILRCKGC